MYEHRAIDHPFLPHVLEYIRSQLELINKFTEEPDTHNLDPGELATRYGERVVGTFPLLRSIHEASRDVAFLATHDSVGSAYVLGRALVERAINYCFLLSCDQEDYLKWVRHSRQKAFRLLERSRRAGEASFRFGINHIPDPSEVPGLEEDLRLFTSKKGREISRWTRLSLEDRVKLTEDRTPNFGKQALWLLAGLAAVYDIGSEAVHGTLYGVGFTFGLYERGKSSKTGQISILLGAAAFTLNAVLTALGIASKHDDIVETSIFNLKAMVQNISPHLHNE